MASRNVEVFQAARKVIKLHPDWDDEKVAEQVGARDFEMGIIVQARKDAAAGG
jgi:hypothetical protein